MKVSPAGPIQAALNDHCWLVPVVGVACCSLVPPFVDEPGTAIGSMLLTLAIE